jgi:hypothetical protein
MTTALPTTCGNTRILRAPRRAAGDRAADQRPRRRRQPAGAPGRDAARQDQGLEQRIMEMVRNSSDNASIAHKMHRWSCAAVQDPRQLPHTVSEGIQRELRCPRWRCACGMWPALPGRHVHHGRERRCQVLRHSLTMPFCGPTWASSPPVLAVQAQRSAVAGAADAAKARTTVRPGLRPAGAGLARSCVSMPPWVTEFLAHCRTCQRGPGPPAHHPGN